MERRVWWGRLKGKLIVLQVRKPRCCKGPQGLLPRFSSTQGLLPHFSSTQGLLPRFSSTQGLLPHFSSTQGLLPHFSSTQGLLPRFSSTQGLLPRFSSTQGLLPRFSSTQGLLPRFSSTQADGQEQLFHLTDNIHSEFFIAVEPIDTYCVLISSKVVYFLKPCEFVDHNAIFLEVKYDDLNHFLVSKDHGKVYVQLTKKAESTSSGVAMPGPPNRSLCPELTRQDLVNDLKRAGTTVSKKTISNTLRRHGLKSCSARKVPLLKPAHVQARLKFANDHLDDPKEEMGEGHVV
ncbi:hypothetical protein J4Q44_G00211480 [Coregonus suidteri]|uniref:Transposase Tc1-like domain-containing protein n=1 Tax=Coregonus suidteri TaxID=861788 RepID=A0AAN8L968_9TELE